MTIRTLRFWLLAMPTAVVLLALGQVFGLNGSQWDWWSSASFVAAVFVLCVPLLLNALSPAAQALGRGGLLVVAALGVAALTASVTIMSVRYSDPYAGRLLWPHLLAVSALAGFIAAVLAALASRSPFRGSRDGRETPISPA